MRKGLQRKLTETKCIEFEYLKKESENVSSTICRKNLNIFQELIFHLVAHENVKVSTYL